MGTSHTFTLIGNLGSVLALAVLTQDKSPYKALCSTCRTNTGSFSVEHYVKILISILLFIFTLALPISLLLEGSAFIKRRNNTTASHTQQRVSKLKYRWFLSDELGSADGGLDSLAQLSELI